MNNRFLCDDNFVVRIPENSVEFGERLKKKTDSASKFIIDNGLEEELYTSSKDLYNAFLRKRLEEKTNASILKYMVRSWCRPTPYGELSGIARGRFTSGEEICRIAGKRKKVRTDMQWLIGLLLRMEKEKGEDLVVFKNTSITEDTCFIYNNWVSCFYYDERYHQNCIQIKKDTIINIILDKAVRGVTIKELLKMFPQDRDSRKKILKSIQFLLHNEFLLSEFHYNLLNCDFEKKRWMSILFLLKSRYQRYKMD